MCIHQECTLSAFSVSSRRHQTDAQRFSGQQTHSFAKRLARSVKKQQASPVGRKYGSHKHFRVQINFGNIVHGKTFKYKYKLEFQYMGGRSIKN